MRISIQFILPLSYNPIKNKERNMEKFLSQRIARRDIDNTHRVNGIS